MEDVDQLLVEEELVQCIMKIDGVGLGRFVPGSDKPDAAKGTEVQIPLWLALALNKKNMVHLKLPAHFGKAVRADLEAGAMSLNLRLYSQNFFKVGLSLAAAMEDEKLRAELRAALSGERYEHILDWSMNSEDKDITELTDKLTADEQVLFYSGFRAATNVQNWKKRRVEQLNTNPVFKRDARKAARA